MGRPDGGLGVLEWTGSLIPQGVLVKGKTSMQPSSRKGVVKLQCIGGVVRGPCFPDVSECRLQELPSHVTEVLQTCCRDFTYM